MIKYDYASVQIDLPRLLSNKIKKWSVSNVKKEDLFEPKGREEDLHVTVLYGIHTNQPNEIKKVLVKEKPFKVKLGNISKFVNAEFEVLKIEVSSLSLTYLHHLLKSSVENTQTFSKYHPHVTIAYLKKDNKFKIKNKMEFNGMEWEVNNLVYSSKNNKKIVLKL